MKLKHSKVIKADTKIRRRSVKASDSRGYFVYSPHDEALLRTLRDTVSGKFDGKSVGSVDIYVGDVRSAKKENAFYFEISFQDRGDYNNDMILKVISTGDPARYTFLARLRNSYLKLVDEFDIRMSGSGSILSKKIEEIADNMQADSVESAESVKCTTRRIRASAESGVMIKTETAEGTYYLTKSATKRKTFWSEKFDSANRFAKKESAVNKLYSVLQKLADNAFYDGDDMFDIEDEADLKKAKFAKFYITDTNGNVVEDISNEVKNHLLSDDSFVSEVLDDFDDEDVEASTTTRPRRSIKASIGDDVYADDIKDVIRNAGIRVLDVKKSRIHNSDSFFSILLDNTNDFHAVVDAITDAGYGVTYDYPAVDGNWAYIMISDNREDDAFLYRVVYGYQSEVVPMDDETSDYQAVLDACIDMKEARGDKDLHTYDEIEEEGWNEDEYVTGGNRGLALYTGGNFMIEPIGRGKLSEYVGSSTRISAARDTTVDKDAVRELVLYITNDASLYPQVQAIVKNMKQKIKRGKYDDELAVKAWQYLADEGVAKYDKKFGSGGGTKAMLNKATREQIARELRDEYADMVNEGVEAAQSITCANGDGYHLYGYDANGADVSTSYADKSEGYKSAAEDLFAYPEVDTVDVYLGGYSGDGDYVITLTRGDVEASKSVTCSQDISGSNLITL